MSEKLIVAEVLILIVNLLVLMLNVKLYTEWVKDGR